MVKIHQIQLIELKQIISSALVNELVCKKDGENFLIDGSKETFVKILDELSNVLMQKGFEESKINGFGLQIETLVDKLAPSVYDCED